MRRSRMVVGKLRALRPGSHQGVVDIVALRLAGTLRPSRAGRSASLKLSIAKLSSGKHKLDPASTDWLITEVNLVYLELLTEASGLRREEERETHEQLQVLGELIAKHASEAPRTALHKIRGWPSSLTEE